MWLNLFKNRNINQVVCVNNSEVRKDRDDINLSVNSSSLCLVIKINGGVSSLGLGENYSPPFSLYPLWFCNTSTGKLDLNIQGNSKSVISSKVMVVHIIL